MTLLHEFRRHLATLRLPPGRGLIAVSGGPDSAVLLDLLHHTREQHRLDLVVGHFEHGIHPDSATVAAQVRASAGAYHLAYEEGRGELGPGAGETLARQARYAWLEATCLRVGATILFTAHHADDQIETVLMRALCGSGPAGLAGMLARRAAIVRPLLPFRREVLGRYLRSERLRAWDDPANGDPRHLRAWVRGDLLPMLRTRLPKVDESLLSVGRQAARDRAAWSAALELLPGLDFRLERDGFSVAAGVLSGYDSALAESVLMSAARRVGCRLGPVRAGRLLRVATQGTSGATMPLGAGWAAELAFGRLLVGPELAPSVPAAWGVVGLDGERQWGRWRIRWVAETAPLTHERHTLTAWVAAAAPLEVRGWTAGERIRPIGGAGRRLVVRCFQDARVPRSRRAEWPVLAGPDGAVWVPGVCRSDALLPVPATEALRIDAEYA